jgi:hypothetical protein
MEEASMEEGALARAGQDPLAAARSTCERPGCSASAGHGLGWVSDGGVRWFCVEHFMESLARLSGAADGRPERTAGG